ncbi:MAG: NDP-sugar synthase [Elusimicrobia bacterium]|nr:NDP-sugar synthase [Elusimicrobiota bacterium]
MHPKVTQALVLLGGKGERLKDLTQQIPKPLLPLCGKPLLQYVLEHLKSHGIRKAILSLCHLPEQFQAFLQKDPVPGLAYEISVESSPLGTAGAIRHALPRTQETTLVLNGDLLTDFDLSAMQDFHQKKSAHLTIAMVAVPNPSSFGVIETDPDGKILRFLEKPQPHQTPARTINAGYYLLEPEILEWIPPGKPCSIEREIFPKLIENQKRLFGYALKGYWLDIGTPERYRQAEQDLRSGKLKLV